MYYFYRGALTSKSYSFVGRSWEFKNIDMVDFFDPLGSSIRIDIRGEKLIRILPRLNEEVNSEWISDKIRFAIDGFRSQRIDVSLFKVKDFIKTTWFESLLVTVALFFGLLRKNNYFYLFFNTGTEFFKKRSLLINYITGAFSDFKSEYTFDVLLNTFFYLKTDPMKLNNLVTRKNFFLKFKLLHITAYSVITTVGLNFRYDYPIFNIRLRQHALKNNITILNFGTYFTSTFPILFVGGIKQFYSFCLGSHWLSSNFLQHKSLLLFNENIFSKMKFNWLNDDCLSAVTFSVLTRSLNSLLSLEAGTYTKNVLASPKTLVPNIKIFNSLPSKINKISNSLVEKLTNINNIHDNEFYINFSHHGDSRLLLSNIILPVPAPFEREGLISNVEGRICSLRLVLAPPKNVLSVVDSVTLLFLLLLKLRTYNNNFLLNLFLLNLFSIQGTSNLIWGFVSNFLSMVKSSKILVSVLFKRFKLLSMLEILLPNNENFFENFDYNQNSQKNIKLINQFNVFTVNSTITNFDEINTNYYVQDEISSSSVYLVSANERLLSKITYIL